MAKFRIVFIVVAIISVAFLVFAPLFSIFDKVHLTDVLEEFFNRPKSIESFYIMVPMAMLVCTFILLVTGITGRKSAFIGASIASIIIFAGVIVAQFFITSYKDFGDYMSLVVDHFGFNIWAQIAIYVISLILGIVSPVKETATNAYGYPYGQAPQYNPNMNQPYNNGQPYYGQNAQQNPYQQGYQQQNPYQQPQAPYYQQQPDPYQQQAPYQQPQTPYQQQQDPFQQPQTPYQQQQDPFQQQQDPFQQQQDPFQQQQDPFQQQQNPFQQPQSYYMQGQVPFDQPGQPQSDDQQNDISYQQPDLGIQDENDATVLLDDVDDFHSDTVCPSCGTACPEGTTFCTNCGAHLN